MRLDQATRCRLWRQQNPDRAAITRRLRKGEVNKQAIPAWTDHKAVKAIYVEARRLTRVTGIEHHVDHIVPLNGRFVSGLHVHYNLRVATKLDNLRKGNAMPDHALLVSCEVSNTGVVSLVVSE